MLENFFFNFQININGMICIQQTKKFCIPNELMYKWNGKNYFQQHFKLLMCSWARVVCTALQCTQIEWNSNKIIKFKLSELWNTSKLPTRPIWICDSGYGRYMRSNHKNGIYVRKAIRKNMQFYYYEICHNFDKKYSKWHFNVHQFIALSVGNFYAFHWSILMDSFFVSRSQCTISKLNKALFFCCWFIYCFLFKW